MATFNDDFMMHSNLLAFTGGNCPLPLALVHHLVTDAEYTLGLPDVSTLLAFVPGHIHDILSAWDSFP